MSSSNRHCTFLVPRSLLALLVAGASLCLPAQTVQPLQTARPLAPTPTVNGPQSGVQSGVQGRSATSSTPQLAPSAAPPAKGSYQPLGVAPTQSGPGTNTPFAIQSLVRTPTLSPGALELLELEGRFSQAVAAGGGRVFATWFADDAVTLNNGRPAVQGRGNIAAEANWDAKSYQLSWVPEGAQMGPSNDMGFTWGNYEGRSKDKNGGPIVLTGRFITIWRKQPDGSWKVAMDASANAAPGAGTCCSLPKP